MATLIQLCESGALELIDPLEDQELPWRTLYGTPELISWLDDKLPCIEHNDLYGDLTPLEQVFGAFVEYALGEEFIDDRRFKKLTYTPEYFVWEIKTEEVRIFGWAPHKDAFVCTFGDSKDDIETFRRYGKYIAQTEFVRNNLDLDEPKFVSSGEYDDVISTKN